MGWTFGETIASLLPTAPVVVLDVIRSGSVKRVTMGDCDHGTRIPLIGSLPMELPLNRVKIVAVAIGCNPSV
jgi:hypothetical protein